MRTFDKSGQPEQWVIALALDQYPAQVLSAWVPELRNRPFVVYRQRPDSHKSTVWACSREAMRMRLRPGIPLHVIRKRYPRVLAVPQNLEIEEIARDEITDILYTFSPDIYMEQNGNAFMEITGTPALRKMTPEDIAGKIRHDIKFKVGLLEVAAGVSRSKLTAKVLARSAKPDGIKYCRPGEEMRTLAPMDTRILPGLSHQCREKMKDYAIRQIGQLQRFSRAYLESRFGGEGNLLYCLAHGINQEQTRALRHCIKAETLFNKDVNNLVEAVNHIRCTADKLCHRLRQRNLQASRMTFVLKYADNKSEQKTAAFPEQTDDFEMIAKVASRLFFDLYRRRVAVKGISLSASNPIADTGQLELFETEHTRKNRKIGTCISAIREKMGFDKILNASML